MPRGAGARRPARRRLADAGHLRDLRTVSRPRARPANEGRARRVSRRR
ncbi:MAG: flagellar hook capping protein [Chloroflexi bacterium]|nr:flagellar hook capping protein [Chloroflexota bacterium]